MLTAVGRAAGRRVQTTRLPSCASTPAQSLYRQSPAATALPIRSFSLSGWAGLPSSGNDKAVKKTPAKKTAATNTKSKSKATDTKSTKTKAAAKTKAAKATKSPKEKPEKKPKKQVDPETLKKLQIREIKKWALNDKVPQLPHTRWTLYLSEQRGNLAQEGGNITTQVSELSKGFRELSETELKDLDDRAAVNREKNKEHHEAWVKSHEPARIYMANKARRRLANLTGKPYKGIADDRLPQRPNGSYTLFLMDHYSRTDSEENHEKFKEIGRAWRELSPHEKSRYEERNAETSVKYRAEIDKLEARANAIKAAEANAA